jgi:glycosyltransferase involved in cell wall biosynthesis
MSAALLLLRETSPTLAYLPSLALFLRHARPDALLAATPFMNIEAVLAQRLAGVPMRLVVSEHNDLSSGHPYGCGWHGRLLAALLRRAYRDVDAVVAVSAGVASDVQRRTGLTQERIIVIYNPIASPDLPDKAQAEAEHPWLAAGQPPIIMGAGRLGRAKDFPTLLRAFARIRKHRPVRLIILGEAVNAKKTGRQRAKLAALARELGIAGDIDFPGFVQNPYSYMSRASVFALTSLYEGFGNVLAEAMACGCPVVSTDCRSGPAEILDHGRYGPLVAVGDDAALAGAIEALLDAPPERRLLQQRGFEFNVERAIDRYEQLLTGSTLTV